MTSRDEAVERAASALRDYKHWDSPALLSVARIAVDASGLLEVGEERDRLHAALEAIAKEDDLVTANEGAFSVHAFRRCRDIALTALRGPTGEPKCPVCGGRYYRSSPVSEETAP